MKHFHPLPLLAVWLLAMLMSLRAAARECPYQYQVRLTGEPSSETGEQPVAHLWVPDGCSVLNAVMVGCHNMTEETIFNRPSFRAALAAKQVGIIWISPIFSFDWDPASSCQQVFEQMMVDLGRESGHDELARVACVPIGHSAMATFPWNFAAWNNERTLAVVSFHGDAPRTNLCGYGRANVEWGRTRNIDGIPGLMVEGEYEWWEARVTPALAFQIMYPASCISFLCDAERGHFDASEETCLYIARFVAKALDARLLRPATATEFARMRPLLRTDGWLAKRWNAADTVRPEAAPYADYQGDVHDAFWYIDGEMARLTEERYRRSLGKEMQYVSVEQDGVLVPYRADRHVTLTVPFRPLADGLSFRLTPVFVDSLRAAVSVRHAAVAPRISKICGPVRQVDDTTFCVDFSRVDRKNTRRSRVINLVVEADGDARYKGTVQEMEIVLPEDL